MMKKTIVCIFLPVGFCLFLFFLKDYFEHVNRFDMNNLLGHLIDILYYWPLLILNKAGVVLSQRDGMLQVWRVLSLLISIGIHTGIACYIFESDDENA